MPRGRVLRGKKREEAAGGPVTFRSGERGSSIVSSARAAIASPGGPTHLHTALPAQFSNLHRILSCISHSSAGAEMVGGSSHQRISRQLDWAAAP